MPVEAREATDEELLAVHTPELLAVVDATACRSFTQLDPDTYASSGSASSARLAAGGLLDMTRAVVEGRLSNGLALVRPPGHHAEADRAMGFCLFNNVAVAAKAAQNVAAKAAQNAAAKAAQSVAAKAAQNAVAKAAQSVAAKAAQETGVGAARETADGAPDPSRPLRILIVDWDVHHGNGTQHAFWDDPNVLYFSTHQSPFYPGTGTIGETGGRGAPGRTINVPWPAGRGDADHLAAFDRVLLPAAREFQPDLTIVSAGFDAAQGDLLGQQRISPAGYAAMTARLMTLASGRLVLALEGGYALDAIAASAAACVRILLGETPPETDFGPAGATASRVLDAVIAAHRPLWPGVFSI